MAQIRKLETPDANGVWIESGKDHGKPVRYKVRSIPHDVDRRLYRDAYRDTKLRTMSRQSAAAALERMQDYTLLRAVYALVDTDNFSIEIGDQGAAEIYSKLIGEKVEAGAEIVLDGKWTDELRKDVFSTARKRAAWISNKADKQTEAEIADEEEEAEDF